MKTMKSRFAAILAVVAVGLVALVVFASWQSRTTLLAERKQNLRSYVDAGQSIIDRYVALEKAGKLSREDAQRQAMDELRVMRWDDGTGYFFLFDSKPVMLMHPVSPKLVGTDVGDKKDSNGKELFREMVALDKREGKGFIDYTWPKPDGKGSLPKVSYVSMTPAWDWHLGTGVYIEDVQQAFYGVLLRFGAFAAFVALLVFGVVSMAVRGVSRSIGGEPHVAMAMATRIAGGDLHAQDEESFDEGSVLHALASMRGKLAGIVNDVRQGTEIVRTGTEQISQGNDDLSQRTQEQASGLEETASSMEELTATVRQNAENAHAANKLAREARDEAKQGGEVVQRAVSAMDEIGEASRRIGDIVGLIDEIAFQTNLLALNAAVEAARAGEQGRGFAVVATEVRSLAQRSATAAREIKGLINDSAEKVGSGSQLVAQSGKALQGIFASVAKVSDIVAEIAAASQEQSAGIEQVNRAVLQMDETTQQNAALVEEAAAASHTMREQADLLADRVAFFQIGAGEASRPASTVRHEGAWQAGHLDDRGLAMA
ncbi:methyl-accepting chemotaxis protein [Dyella sp.]|uniref:methyl-accepting chemotaxis protein n=1 Tax=Dyella sp. TaxID=1869338 RepID=UPI002ED09D73